MQESRLGTRAESTAGFDDGQWSPIKLLLVAPPLTPSFSLPAHPRSHFRMMEPSRPPTDSSSNGSLVHREPAGMGMQSRHGAGSVTQPESQR